MTKNKNAQGILLITLGMFVFAIQDSITKFIYKDIALYEMYFIRSLVSFLIRVILFFFGFSSFYISLTIMPLATANALFFCSPFIITIFARFILKEEVGIQRWLAVIIGFIGVYIILNPDFNNFDYLKLLPIICAFCYATSMIIIRKTSEKDNVYSQVLQFYIAGMFFSILFYFLAGNGQYNTIDHPAAEFVFRKWFSNLEFTMPYMVIIGVVAAGAFISIFTAYRISSPAVISPFEYTSFIFVGIMGYIFYNEIPNSSIVIGAILIVLGGLYIAYRENKIENTLKVR